MRLLLLVMILCAAVAWAHNSYTGGYSSAPGRQSCASSCHGGTGGTLAVTGFPTSYQPLQTYTITIRHNGGSRIVNFNATTRVGSTSTVAGTFVAGLNSILYTGADGGVYASPHSIDSAVFQWRAPAVGSGTVNFYAAGFQGTTSSSNGQSSRVTFSATESISSPPEIPVQVSPSNNSVGTLPSLRIVWRQGARASSYRLQVATDTGFTALVVHDSTLVDTSRLVTGLQFLTTYYWRVSASNVIGGSGFTTQWNFKTLGFPTQVATINPPDSAVNQPTTILFRWQRALDQTLSNPPHTRMPGDGPESILGYWHEMVMDTTTMAGIVRDTTLTDTTKTLSSLNNLTTYFWRVKAKNQAGWGSFGTWWRFTTIVQIPDVVTLLAPAHLSTITRDTVRFIWLQGSPQVDHYEIRLATDSLFGGMVLDSTLTDTSFVFRQLQNQRIYWWRVLAHNPAGWGAIGETRSFGTVITGVKDPDPVPTEFCLEQNYPNPFNPATTINYSLPKDAFVTLTLYNPLGQEVATLVAEDQKAGHRSFAWNGAVVASGVYYYRLQAGDFVSVKKMLLLK